MTISRVSDSDGPHRWSIRESALSRVACCLSCGDPSSIVSLLESLWNRFGRRPSFCCDDSFSDFSDVPFLVAFEALLFGGRPLGGAYFVKRLRFSGMPPSSLPSLMIPENVLCTASPLV